MALLWSPFPIELSWRTWRDTIQDAGVQVKQERRKFKGIPSHNSWCCNASTPCHGKFLKHPCEGVLTQWNAQTYFIAAESQKMNGFYSSVTERKQFIQICWEGMLNYARVLRFVFYKRDISFIHPTQIFPVNCNKRCCSISLSSWLFSDCI